MKTSLALAQCALIAFIFSFVGGNDVLAGDRVLECPAKGKGKVIVCHIPPGNPEQKHIIAIGKSALDAHLSHGDKSGICPSTTYQEMKDMCGICDIDMDPTC